MYKNVHNCFCLDFIIQWKRWTQKDADTLAKTVIQSAFKSIEEIIAI